MIQGLAPGVAHQNFVGRAWGCAECDPCLRSADCVQREQQQFKFIGLEHANARLIVNSFVANVDCVPVSLSHVLSTLLICQSLS